MAVGLGLQPGMDAGPTAARPLRAPPEPPDFARRLTIGKNQTYKDTMLSAEVRKGSAELLVLGTLEDQPRHGYDIARLIELRSRGAIVVHSATLYPPLHRLERRGLIVGRWIERAGVRRRRFYRITPAGRRALRDQRRSWRDFVEALGRAARIREV
jgi:transcriptional regulator